MPLVPYVIEQTGRGERMYDVYSRLLKERIIFLGTPIDSEVANVIVAQLLLLDSQSSEQEISMYINCPGGDVYAGLAIYDTMRYIKAPVSTICVGIAMSMGSVLLMAGTRASAWPCATASAPPARAWWRWRACPSAPRARPTCCTS